jgi:hypothetical protein
MKSPKLIKHLYVQVLISLSTTPLAPSTPPP